MPRLRNSSQHSHHLTLLCAAAAGALFLAAPAGAQEPGSAYAYSNGPETVIVAVPRQRPERSEIGAPIRDVSISREVRFDDLDLSTDSGARHLRNRIEYTARALCTRLDVAYPVATSDSPPCYQSAVAGAMVQADRAIADARGADYD